MVLLLPTFGIICLLAGPSFSQTRTEEPIISGERVAARRELGALGLQYSKDALVKQASEGDTVAETLFLLAGMDANSKDKDGNTALCAAASAGYLETVQALIARGADVDLKNNVGLYSATPLIQAVSEGYHSVQQHLMHVKLERKQ